MKGLPPNTSLLCEAVAREDLVRNINSYGIHYTDSGLFGIYTECDKEKIPRLMEVVMNVFQSFHSLTF